MSGLYQIFLAGHELNPPNRPIGTMLFLGPTGSGKTRRHRSCGGASSIKQPLTLSDNRRFDFSRGNIVLTSNLRRQGKMFRVKNRKASVLALAHYRLAEAFCL